MMNLFKGKKRFVLIGHSFGALIAVELAKLLEQNGLTGEVICTDGSVLLFKRYLEMLMPSLDSSEENIQNFLFMQLAFEILPDIDLDSIRKILVEVKTHEARVEKFLSLMTKSDYSDAYLNDISYGLTNRVKMVLNENEEYSGERIKSNITLIRPSINLVVDIDNDYKLKQYTSGQVFVSFIEGNHLTMLDNTQLYQIINNICTNDQQ